MDCRVINKWINSYLDGMLEERRKGILEDHINTDCKKQLDDIKNLLSMMGQMEEAELPENFHKKLHQRLLKEQQNIEAESRKSGRSSVFKCIKWTAAAAAAAVMLFSIKVLDLHPFNKSRDESANPPITMETDDFSTAQQPSLLSDYLNEFKLDACPEEIAKDNGYEYFEDDSYENAGETRDALNETDYIGSNRVELLVQDASITPQTIQAIALKHGIAISSLTEHYITLQFGTANQKKALYQDLKQLGRVEESGVESPGDRITIFILQEE